MKSKIYFYLPSLLLLPLLFNFVSLKPNEELAINSPIPMAEYKMNDVSGKMLSLGDLKTNKGLLVIFSCNTCPYVKLSENRIKEYSNYCLKNQIGCVIVNSNEAQRNEDDGFEAMKAYYSDQGLKCAYTIDINSQLADAFGATRTPQCFLFDKTILIYKGAIDDNVKDQAAVKAPYLKEALESLLADQKPKVQQTKSIGCTIKRLE